MARHSQPSYPARKDHFLRLMFFQPSRAEADESTQQHEQPVLAPDTPLHRFIAHPGIRYALPAALSAPPVKMDSPATAVMTDLRVVPPLTVSADASIDFANQRMIDKRVRALFVVDDTTRHVTGIITSTDILGERPLQMAQQQGLRHGGLLVGDIMTPADKLEVLHLSDIVRARVSNIVATLQQA